MKIHRPIVQTVVQALQDVFERGFYADKVIEHHLRLHKKWGGRDRRFFAEAVYDIVRWWRKLWFELGSEPAFDRDQLYRLIGVWLLDSGYELPDWPELKSLRGKKAAVASSAFAVRESFPDWLDELGRDELGAEWEKAASALNRPAEVVLRTNTNLTQRSVLQRRLAEEGVDTAPLAGSEVALVLNERKNVFQTQAFKEGLFEVQDAVSQKIAPLLELSPGQRVIDACAGAGGKTLHIADLLRNQGKIIALDVSEKKLLELKKRIRRNRFSIVETRPIENRKVLKRLKESADRLLLDVPCSGLGVLRRNPDTKWKLSRERLDEVNALQKEILGSYHEMVRPGGVMVYSTCSILPRENEKVVELFLKTHYGEWTLRSEHHWLPHTDGFDGFYAAVLKKND